MIKYIKALPSTSGPGPGPGPGPAPGGNRIGSPSNGNYPILNGEVGQKTTPTTLDVIISPNPAQNVIQLSYQTLELENETAISLSIIGVNGQIVYNQQYDNISDLPLRLSLEGMNAGIYSVVLKTTSSTTAKKLIVVK
jgi:hypothetical protein